MYVSLIKHSSILWQTSSSFLEKNVILEQCKGMHCVDLGESFQTHIYLQKLVSIQPRKSPVKFARSSSIEPAIAPKRRSLRMSAFAKAQAWECRVRSGSARSDKLDRARSRLYRLQILQENTRLKALAEIYTTHSFAQLENHIFSKRC